MGVISILLLRRCGRIMERNKIRVLGVIVSIFFMPLAYAMTVDAYWSLANAAQPVGDVNQKIMVCLASNEVVTMLQAMCSGNAGDAEQKRGRTFVAVLDRVICGYMVAYPLLLPPGYSLFRQGLMDSVKRAKYIWSASVSKKDFFEYDSLDKVGFDTFNSRDLMLAIQNFLDIEPENEMYVQMYSPVPLLQPGQEDECEMKEVRRELRNNSISTVLMRVINRISQGGKCSKIVIRYTGNGKMPSIDTLKELILAARNSLLALPGKSVAATSLNVYYFFDKKNKSAYIIIDTSILTSESPVATYASPDIPAPKAGNSVTFGRGLTVSRVVEEVRDKVVDAGCGPNRVNDSKQEKEW